MRVPAQPAATFEFPDVAVAGLGARIDTPAGVPVIAWAPATLAVGIGWAVTLALPVVGDYLLRWQAPDFPPIRFEAVIPLEIVAALTAGGAPTLADLTPTAEQVAALVLSRTREDETGQQAGVFTADTRPTIAAVLELIARATAEVVDQVGVAVPVGYADEVARVAAVRAAGLITLSLDDLGTDDSAQRRYDAMYLSGLERLKARPWERGLEIC